MAELTENEEQFFESGGEAPEVEPEEKVEPEAKAEPEEKIEKTVPYNALHEERMMRKEAQEQLIQMREQINQLSGLKEELESYREDRQKNQFEEQFDEDPIGALRKQTEQLSETITSQQTEQQTQAAQQAQMQQFQQAVVSQVQSFQNEHDDYQEALQFVMNRRMHDYEALGVDDPAQRMAQFDQESMQIAQMAIQQGKNPAAVVYELAQSWGYNRASIDDKLETLEKGQAKSQSLSDAGGSNDKISLADIENMPEDEFEKLWADMERAG